MLHKPGGETHNIFGVDEDDEQDKKPGKKTLMSPTSHDIFGLTGPIEGNTTPKTNRLPPGGASHGIFGALDASNEMERPRTHQPPGGKSRSIFGSDQPVEKPGTEKRSSGGIFGGPEVETTRPTSRVLKPPGGGSSNIFG